MLGFDAKMNAPAPNGSFRSRGLFARDSRQKMEDAAIPAL